MVSVSDLRVVLYAPGGLKAASLEKFVGSRPWDVRRCETWEDLSAFSPEESLMIDGFFVPLEGSDGVLGSDLIAAARKASLFPNATYVAFGRGYDRVALRTFFESGADLVFFFPYEREIVVSSVLAAKRRRIEKLRVSSSTGASTEFYREVFLSFLDFLSEGILITDEQVRIIYCNKAAQTMLGTAFLADAKERSALESSLRASMLENKPEKSADGSREFSTRGFYGFLRSSGLHSGDNTLLGYAFSLIEKRTVQHIAELLAQSERMSSLALTLASALMTSLKASDLGPPSAPYARVKKLLDEAKGTSELSAVVTSLCEVMDSVLSPASVVKVGKLAVSTVGVPAPALFRLLGFVLLNSTENAGIGGETSIGLHPGKSDRTVLLVVTSKALHEDGGKSSDIYSTSISKNRSTIATRDGSLKKLPYGLQAARDLAVTFGCGLKYRPLSRGEIQIEIELPVAG